MKTVRLVYPRGETIYSVAHRKGAGAHWLYAEADRLDLRVLKDSGRLFDAAPYEVSVRGAPYVWFRAGDMRGYSANSSNVRIMKDFRRQQW